MSRSHIHCLKPAATDIRLARHCVEQFRSRIREALSAHAAREELQRLVLAGRIVSERPAWLGQAGGRLSDRYLLLGDDVVLPLIGLSDGGMLAVTCIARGSLHPRDRARRQARRRRRRTMRRPDGAPRPVPYAREGRSRPEEQEEA